MIHSGIVPNGIATITYQFRRSSGHGHGFTITVPAINNVVVFKVPPGYQPGAHTLTLRAADGTTIRTFDTP